MTLAKMHTLLLRIEDLFVLFQTSLWTRWLFKRCGSRCRLRFLRLINPSRIEIGDRVNILQGCRMEACVEYEGVRHEPYLILGSRVSISAPLRTTGVSPWVKALRSWESEGAETLSETKSSSAASATGVSPWVSTERSPLKSRPVRIGAESTINNGVVIMPGVTIGRHCSIGANSVVTKDIPDYCVAAGVPVRIIRRYNLSSGAWERPGSEQPSEHTPVGMPR